MLTFWGKQQSYCDRISRRDFLRVGGIGLGGLSLASLLASRAGAGPSSRPKAKAVIVFGLIGGPPQHETFDPKPDALPEVQGEMKAIATTVPGVRVCDHLPRVAGTMHRVTVGKSSHDS